MTHPFEKMFEKALKHSTREDNKVLLEAEKLSAKGYARTEIVDVLTKLKKSLIADSDVEILADALEEFVTL